MRALRRWWHVYAEIHVTDGVKGVLLSIPFVLQKYVSSYIPLIYIYIYIHLVCLYVIELLVMGSLSLTSYPLTRLIWVAYWCLANDQLVTHKRRTESPHGRGCTFWDETF